MSYTPTTTEQMLRDAGEDSSRVESITPEQPYDRARAYGSSGKDVDLAREAARFGSGSGTPGPSGLVLETRGNDGEFGIRHEAPKRTRGITGLSWSMATEAILDRPAHHTVAAPAEVAEAWAAVEAAVEAANAAEQKSRTLFHEVNAAPPRQADWVKVDDAEDKARALLTKAKTQRARYDQIVPAHLDGEGTWATAVSHAVVPAHVEAMAALAAAEQAVASLDAAVQAALAAGQARGEQAAHLPYLRPVTDALSTARAALSGYDPERRITENKLPLWSRQERKEIAAMGNTQAQHRLWLLERDEHKRYTNLMGGFIPDGDVLRELR